MQSPLEPSGNRLLDRLEGEERARLFEHLLPVTFTQGETVYHPDESIQRVYFPSSGLVSVVTTSQSGESMEIGMVGFEGLAGLAAVLGDGIAHNRHAVVQIDGGGSLINADLLRERFNQSAQLRGVLLRYAQAYVTQVSQSAFCQCFHHVEERLARWLLECQFRVRSDEFHLTHDYIAELLGFRRAGVTEAMQALKEKGLVSYSRGDIKILGQEGLEAAACECYRIIRAEFERLFG